MFDSRVGGPSQSITRRKVEKGTIDANADLRLFVAGVPSIYPPGSLLDYFLQFGLVDSLTPVRTNKKGCYVLSTQCLDTKTSILSVAHFFLGRTLHISEYRTGDQLDLHVQDMNSRRVVVKKVPQTVSEDMLRSLMEGLFGEIQSLFKFKARSHVNQASLDRNQKQVSFSVLFISPDSAAKAVDTFSVSLTADASVDVERYVPNTTEQRRQIKKQQQGYGPISAMEDVNILSIQCLPSPPYEYLEPRTDCHERRHCPVYKYHAGQTFISSEWLVKHQNKPTSSLYFLEGRTSNSWARQSNYRFNKKRGRLQ